ncbi:MAG: glycosyltransferase family 9 protein [Oligoflexia bacterium]|nr:glycosyltransferase family 9 protein [Oligoflexia bacterium]
MNEKSSIIQKIDLCIVQISRIGDVLQTIRALQLFFKGPTTLSILFIGRKEFAGPLEFLLKKYCKHIIYLDFKNNLNRTSEKALLKQYVSDFISSINQYEIDKCVNLSFSKTSSYLCSLIKASQKLGLSRDKDDNLSISDPWCQYVYSVVMRGCWNPFNLVDIFISVLESLKLRQEVTMTILPSEPLRISQNTTSVVVHPFASIDKKRWEVSKWAYIINYLLSNIPNIEIIVVGAKSDTIEGEKLFSDDLIQNCFGKVTNKIGQTSLEQLYEVMRCSSMFMGHDSMCGHLAAIANIPCVTISLGSVRSHETAPYGNENFVIAPKVACYPCYPDTLCNGLYCHKTISAWLVASFVSSFFERIIDKCVTYNAIDSFLDRAASVDIASIILYKSGLDKNNKLFLDPLNIIDADAPMLFRLYYHIIWSFVLEDKEINFSIPPISSLVATEIQNYLEGIKYIFELNVFGEQYSQFVLDECSNKRPQLDKIKSYIGKISEIDGMSLGLKEKFSLLSPIVDYYYVNRTNLPGKNMIQLASNSLLNFKEANCTLNILNEFILKTIEDYRSKQNVFDSEINISGKSPHITEL